MRSSVTFIAVAAIALTVGFGLGVLFGPQAPAPSSPPLPTVVSEPAVAVATATSFSALTGWRDDALAEALPAFAASCRVFAARPPEAMIGEGVLARPAKDWQRACAAVTEVKDTAQARAVLEQAFEPFAVAASTGTTPEIGTFTGYYEAELTGSLTKDARYRVPVYGLPRDLVTVDLAAFVQNPPAAVPRQLVGRVIPGKTGPTLTPYFTRAQIDTGDAVAETADVLLWADDPVAVHILHIQGSGRVTLPDGRRMRLSFAGSNGQRFKGIGGILLEAKVLKSATMDQVRAWLTAHPQEAAAYMNQNARYIFFRLKDDDDSVGPTGALGIPLTPRRALAVDPRIIPLGAPVWLDTTEPDGPAFRRLMLAQDTGAAITGAVRGDVFWGLGEAAFAKAARMKSKGRYFVLLPKSAAP